MGRRTPRTAQQKLRGFKKKHDKDYDKWLNQFPTRAEVDQMIRHYLGQYHGAEVVPVQELVAEVAKRAGIEPDSTEPMLQEEPK